MDNSLDSLKIRGIDIADVLGNLTNRRDGLKQAFGKVTAVEARNLMPLGLKERGENGANVAEIAGDEDFHEKYSDIVNQRLEAIRRSQIASSQT